MTHTSHYNKAFEVQNPTTSFATSMLADFAPRTLAHCKRGRKQGAKAALLNGQGVS